MPIELERPGSSGLGIPRDASPRSYLFFFPLRVREPVDSTVRFINTCSSPAKKEKLMGIYAYDGWHTEQRATSRVLKRVAELQ